MSFFRQLSTIFLPFFPVADYLLTIQKKRCILVLLGGFAVDSIKHYYNPLDTRTLFVGTHATCAPLHVHNDWEIMVVSEGTVSNLINKVTYNSISGSVYILPPKSTHSFTSSSSHIHWDIYCEDATMKRLCDDIRPDLYDSLFSNIAHFTLPHDELTPLIKNLKRIHNFYPPLVLDEQKHYSTLRAFTNSIISFLLNYHEVLSIEEDTSIPSWLLQFVDMLQQPENFSKRIQEIAKFSNYSYPQLARLFKKYFKSSLLNFVIRLRLNYAESLLLTTNYPILKIATETGYASHTVLTKHFKERFGVTPIKYRKLYAHSVPPEKK